MGSKAVAKKTKQNKYCVIPLRVAKFRQTGGGAVGRALQKGGLGEREGEFDERRVLVRRIKIKEWR